MNNLVTTVSGWEIRQSVTGTYYVYEKEVNRSKEWKRLYNAVKWCKNHDHILEYRA